MVPGPYDVQHVDIKLDEVFTNTTPTDAYRGAGRPEATHLIERLVDALADELGLDAAELRRRNFPTEFPFTTATGLSYDSGEYGKALDMALEMSDYAGFAARRAEAEARGNYRGIGLSTWVEICGLAPSAVTKAIGDRGRRLGVVDRAHPPDRVGDRDHGLVGPRSGPRDVLVADRRERARHPVRPGRGRPRRHRPVALRPRHLRLALAGRRRHRPASDLREGARQGAPRSRRTCSSARPTTSSGRRGRWQVKGSPERAKTIQELAFAAWAGDSMPAGVEPNLEATTFYDPPNFTFPFGSHIAEVEIDAETGKVDDRALHGDRRLRQRDQPDDRRGPGARRHRAVDRPGALRGDGLRRERADPHRLARRLHDPVGGRAAAHGARGGR